MMGSIGLITNLLGVVFSLLVIPFSSISANEIMQVQPSMTLKQAIKILGKLVDNTMGESLAIFDAPRRTLGATHAVL